MILIRVVFAMAGLFAAAGALAGDDPEPCKNHFILRECIDLASELPIGEPTAITVAPDGRVVYFTGLNVVFRVASGGLLERVAGTGIGGYSGDGGPAKQAQLNLPFRVYPGDLVDVLSGPISREHFEWDFDWLVGPLALDASGNLYIGDGWNDAIRRVTPDGVITTWSGGTDVTAIPGPQGLAFDPQGNLVVSHGLGVLRITPDGDVNVAVEAYCWRSPCAPRGTAVDSNGGILFADNSCSVWRIGGDGRMVAIAGRPILGGYGCGNAGDEGLATKAAFGNPFGLAMGIGGDLIIADTWNHCIRSIDAHGIVHAVVGQCGVRGFAGDGGPASQALLDTPHGVAVDALGNLYIADTFNLRVRRVDTDGVITTIAGNGQAYRPLPRIYGRMPGPS